MRSLPLIALAAAFGLTPAVKAQSGPTVVALSGTAAPAGGNYSDFGTFAPVLNGSGQVAFIANLTGGSSTEGVFLGPPGSVQAVALQGTAAPAGGNFSGNFVAPVLNGSGQVAFRCDLTGTTFQGLFVGAPGTVQVAALVGTSSPIGGNYSFLFGPALNGSGQVAFRSNLQTGPSSSGIFVGAPGAIQAAAAQGTAAPAGGNYRDTFNSNPMLNGSGQVAFRGDLTGGSSTQGVFVGAPGVVQPAALQGTAASAGGNYSSFSIPVLNGSGQVAFFANLTGGSSTDGVFVGAPGAVQAVALTGTAAPAGGNYSAFINVPVLNGSGQVAFTASLNGGSSSSGVFVGTPGAVQAAALQGTAALGGGTYGTFNNLVLNGSGRVAFTATLTGAGVTTANDQGLYAGSVGGLVKVVREGDVVDVGGGVMRTVADGGIGFLGGSGGQDGRGVSFNDTALLTYRLTFTDGSSGVFVSQFVPVPEPSGVLAVSGVAGVAFIVVLRRWLGGT